MITPKLLKKGDKIAIISSARKISFEEIHFAIKLFKSWEFDIQIGKTIGQEEHQFAGSDEIRTIDLQTMLDNEEIKAIFFARGGYGSIRILDKINWNSLINNPKWLIGYSDITSILLHIYYNVNINSIHGIMPININNNINNPAILSLKQILFKGTNKIEVKPHILNRNGKIKGKIIGGNLSVIYSLLNSNSFQNTDDIILFIEDLDEYLYHIDRMMQSLKRSGKLSNLKALLVGQMTDMHDNIIPFGKTAYEIIADTVKDYDFPVAFNLPIGHIEQNNHAFIHGQYAEININNNIVTINQTI